MTVVVSFPLGDGTVYVPISSIMFFTIKDDGAGVLKMVNGDKVNVRDKNTVKELQRQLNKRIADNVE